MIVIKVELNKTKMKSLVICLLAVTAVMAQEDCITDTTAACKFERDKVDTRNCDDKAD